MRAILQHLRIITGYQARTLLTQRALVDNADEAFQALTHGDIDAPLRQILSVSGNNLYALMPGASRACGVFGAKIVSLFPDNPETGRPAIQGFVALFSEATGALAALVDGAALTLLRTAAASGAATRRLARVDANTLGVLGAGAQASAHIDAITAVRPVTEILLWARDQAKGEAFADSEAARTGQRIRYTADPADAASANIVCAVTSSSTPILKGEWLQPGAHVNLVGAHAPDKREIDSPGMSRGRLFVESRQSALAEAGDLLIPMSEGVVGPDHLIGEMGDLIDGCLVGRRDDVDITIFKSLGHVAQDLFAAAALLRAAEAQTDGC